jgi:predicted phage replisome organizer
MPEIKWIKLTTTMFDDEKIKLIEAMPEADMLLIIWIKLLCLAGKLNSNGYIFLSENMPYSEEQLATIFNRPVNTIRLALATFKQMGMIFVNDNGFIGLVNWEKHQNIDGMDRVRQLTRERVQRHRNNLLLTQDNNVTDCACNVTERDGNATVTVQKKKENKNKSIYTTTSGEEILLELQKLPGWKEQQDDIAWLNEILQEYPSLNINLIRSCRDWHIGKHPGKKHIWRAALRNWMKFESKPGNNGRSNYHSSYNPNAHCNGFQSAEEIEESAKRQGVA